MARSNMYLALCVRVLVVAVSMFSISPVNASDESLRVVVSAGGDTPAKQLRAFHDRLKEIVGTQALSDAYIECANCQELDQPIPAVKRLTYYYLRERAMDQISFSMAWLDVQRRKPSPTFSIQFDAEQPSGALCEGYVSPPCAPRAFCASMGGCSKQAAPYPCKKCDPTP